MKRIFKSPVLVSGITANAFIAASTVRFFRLPYGAGLDFDNWFLLWGRDSQQAGAKPTLPDNLGLLLSLTPFWLAVALLNLAFELKELYNDG